MPHKTKWKKVPVNSSVPTPATTATATRSATGHTTVLLQLHEMYSQYVDISVIDSIANDCQYNIDMCIDLLNQLTDDASKSQPAPSAKHSHTLPNNVIDMTKLSLNDDKHDSNAGSTTASQSGDNALFFDDIPTELDSSISEADTIQFLKAMFDGVGTDTIQAVWLSAEHKLHDAIQILIAMTSMDTDDTASQSSDSDYEPLSTTTAIRSPTTYTVPNTTSKHNSKHSKFHKINLQPAVNNQWLNNQPTTFADKLLRPDLTSAWKLDALHKAFPTLDADDIESVFYVNNYNFARTMHALNEIYPNTCRDATIDIQPTSDDELPVAPSQAASSATNGTNTLRDIYTNTEYNELTSELSDWINCNVSSTTVYSEVAADARNAANVATVQRQALFNAAATSYLHKKIIDATQYSKKGQQYTSLVDAHNRTAMYATFLQYNYKLSAKKQQIDLHGLYARETQLLLPFVLYHCRHSGNKHVDIITGAGKHSYNRQSRLKPIVVQLVHQLGYTHSVVNDAIVRCKF